MHTIHITYIPCHAIPHQNVSYHVFWLLLNPGLHLLPQIFRLIDLEHSRSIDTASHSAQPLSLKKKNVSCE